MKAKSNAAFYRQDLGIAVMEYYKTDLTRFIGTEVMPIYPTLNKKGSYLVVPKESLLKLYDTSRAPRSNYKRDDFEYERGTYETQEQGWEEPVDDAERNEVDQEAPGTADLVATERAMGIIMRSQEKRIADLLFNETNFTAHSVTTEWDTPASATPIDDVNDGIISFQTSCGMSPDVLIISFTTFRDLKVCDQVVDQIKYTFPGLGISNLNTSQLAQLFGIPRVLVAGGVYDTTGKGLDSTIANIWSSEYAMLAKVGSGRDLKQPCIGRTFLWTADSPSNAIVEEYREEARRSDIYRVRHNVSEALIKSVDTSGTVVSNISAACGYLMKNIHT